MNKYIKAHYMLWNRLICDIRFHKLTSENYIESKRKHYAEICAKLGLPNYESANSCFLCEMIYSHGFKCNTCQNVFKVPTSPECLGGLYTNFVDALYYDRNRASRLAKIIRDIFKKADLRVFGEEQEKM